jgi:hypothetical protein
MGLRGPPSRLPRFLGLTMINKTYLSPHTDKWFILMEQSVKPARRPCAEGDRRRLTLMVSPKRGAIGSPFLTAAGRNRLKSGSCSSARGFAPRFFQRLPHGRHLAVRSGSLRSGSPEDFHLHVTPMLGTQWKQPGERGLRAASASSDRYYGASACTWPFAPAGFPLSPPTRKILPPRTAAPAWATGMARFCPWLHVSVATSRT